MAGALPYIPECCISVAPGRLQAASSTVAVCCGALEDRGAPAARAECLAVAGVLVAFDKMRVSVQVWSLCVSRGAAR